MGLFDLFRSDSKQVRDKIIYTQKTRIATLEKEVNDVKKIHDKRETELNRLRDSHEKMKDRLIEQIVKMSDKFASLNERTMNVAHENARMKLLLQQSKRTTKKASKNSKK
jgi:predicted  nucleic acid-binding Zn-ribbon protein